MKKTVPLIFFCGYCFVCGCSSVGSRVVGEKYFSGVRTDYEMIFNRETFDPSSRVHPALAAVDMPFSLIGDVVFLPYDICSGTGDSASNTK